ncbi:hypothetical protein ACSBQY_08185 [Micrococcus lylae]|uniref:hypothetical protein n=1 Tax=Micrococcus lylae TaxID=1273 RepID=UPI003EB98ADD
MRAVAWIALAAAVAVILWGCTVGAESPAQSLLMIAAIPVLAGAAAIAAYLRRMWVLTASALVVAIFGIPAMFLVVTLVGGP